jgi:anti-sigma regulatory factor (Ser/Thr protein kinase)
MIRTLDLPRDERAPTVARQALDELAPDLDEQTLEDARLLVTELVTNSVRHGRGEQVRVILDRRAADRLRCEVVDDGDGFVPIARAADSTKAGGWGLHLVERLSRDWGVREGSTHVWFELAPTA